MSRDHNPSLRDVTANTENTASSIVACWTVFTEPLPGNALIKSVNNNFVCSYVHVPNSSRNKNVSELNGSSHSQNLICS
jgi:hypothetical protein